MRWFWQKGAENKEEEGESRSKEDEVEGGEREYEDVGGEDTKADWHCVDHGEGSPGLWSIFRSHDKKINTKQRTYLYGGDLADEDEGHHDSKTKTKATQASSQSKWGERLAEKNNNQIFTFDLDWLSPDVDYHEAHDIENGGNYEDLNKILIRNQITQSRLTNVSK